MKSYHSFSLVALLAGSLFISGAAGQVEPAAGAAGRIERPTGALPPGVDPVKAGQELAREVRSLVPGENTRFEGLLTMRKPEGKVITIPVTATTTVSDSSWQIVYETRGNSTIPPERLTLIHRPEQPTEYFYAQGANLNQPTRLQPGQARLPFGGSDFWMADLGLEFLHWPQQKLIKNEMRRSRATRVLDSINTNPPPGSYSRVRSWIDIESGGVLNAEAFDTNSKLMKEFKVDDLQKVEGKWQVKTLQIRNVQNRTSTELRFDGPPPK